MTEQTQAIAVNPLTIPKRSLDELFSIDPMTITDEELLAQVQALREQQAGFLAKEKQPKAKDRVEIPAPSLEDLGL